MKSIIYLVLTVFLYVVNVSNLFAQDVNPVSNLDGVCSDGILTLTWSKPNEIMVENTDWLFYHNSESYSNLGFACLCDIICAQRWSPTNLESLGLSQSSIITKLRFFSNIDLMASTSFFIKIYQGESSTAAGEELFSQEIPENLIIKGEWTEIDFFSPFVIDISKELWIGLASINSGWALATCDSGPIIPGVNKIFTILHGGNNGSWTNLEQLGLDFGNFMIESLVITEKGLEVEVSHYDIYLEDAKLGETIDTIYTTTYIENQHNYCIVAVYDEETQSEKICKEIICKTGIDEYLQPNFTIIPNPATNQVTISSATPFHSVEVFDIYGRKLELPHCVRNDVIPSVAQRNEESQTINISHLHAGIYFVRVGFENGGSVKKLVKQ